MTTQETDNNKRSAPYHRRRLTRKQFEETCYHEAGHAVVSRLLGGTVHYLGVIGNGDKRERELLEQTLDGVCSRSPVCSHADNLVISFAGIEAQYTLLQARTPSADAYQMDGDGDFNNIAFHTRVLMLDGADSGDILDTARRRARSLVLDHRAEIQSVARALMKRYRLTDSDLDGLLGPMTVHNNIDRQTVEKWQSIRPFCPSDDNDNQLPDLHL